VYFLHVSNIYVNIHLVFLFGAIYVAENVQFTWKGPSIVFHRILMGEIYKKRYAFVGLHVFWLIIVPVS